jgi:hypothetical protein
MSKKIILTKIICHKTEDPRTDEIYFVADGNCTKAVRRIRKGETITEFKESQSLVTETDAKSATITVIEQRWTQDGRKFMGLSEELFEKAIAKVTELIVKGVIKTVENISECDMPDIPNDILTSLIEGCLQDEQLKTFDIDLTQTSHTEIVGDDESEFHYEFSFDIVE